MPMTQRQRRAIQHARNGTTVRKMSVDEWAATFDDIDRDKRPADAIRYARWNEDSCGVDSVFEAIESALDIPPVMIGV